MRTIVVLFSISIAAVIGCGIQQEAVQQQEAACTVDHLRKYVPVGNEIRDEERWNASRIQRITQDQERLEVIAARAAPHAEPLQAPTLPEITFIASGEALTDFGVEFVAGKCTLTKTERKTRATLPLNQSYARLLVFGADNLNRIAQQYSGASSAYWDEYNRSYFLAHPVSYLDHETVAFIAHTLLEVMERTPAAYHELLDWALPHLVTLTDAGHHQFTRGFLGDLWKASGTDFVAHEVLVTAQRIAEEQVQSCEREKGSDAACAGIPVPDAPEPYALASDFYREWKRAGTGGDARMLGIRYTIARAAHAFGETHAPDMLLAVDQALQNHPPQGLRDPVSFRTAIAVALK